MSFKDDILRNIVVTRVKNHYTERDRYFSESGHVHICKRGLFTFVYIVLEVCFRPHRLSAVSTTLAK